MSLLAVTSSAHAGSLNASAAKSPVESDGFEEIWTEYGELLTADGITKDIARLASVWTEGQYHLGYCTAHIDERIVNFYRRGWWRNTSLERSQFGRVILNIGDNSWFTGTQDARREHPSAELCQRTVQSWLSDFKAMTTR